MLALEARLKKRRNKYPKRRLLPTPFQRDVDEGRLMFPPRLPPLNNVIVSDDSTFPTLETARSNKSLKTTNSGISMRSSPKKRSCALIIHVSPQRVLLPSLQLAARAIEPSPSRAHDNNPVPENLFLWGDCFASPGPPSSNVSVGTTRKTGKSTKTRQSRKVSTTSGKSSTIRSHGDVPSTTSPTNSNSVDLSNSSIYSMGDNSTISTVDELEGINESDMSFFPVMTVVCQPPYGTDTPLDHFSVHFFSFPFTSLSSLTSLLAQTRSKLRCEFRGQPRSVRRPLGAPGHGHGRRRYLALAIDQRHQQQQPHQGDHHAVHEQ